MPLSAGEKLGPYEILSPIGAGGMGEVYKAKDSRLDRIVAVKVSNSDFTERFEREARAIAALNHPNICTLYDVGPNYLVMEHIEGQPLKGPLPLDKVLAYTAQLCDALDAAHRKGIIHRDLKPSNILTTKQGIKVLDFGIATMAGQPALTQAGAAVGTPAYMAPEQWEGKQADARSDIYSLGCVIHEMATGDRIPHKTLEPRALDRVVKTCIATDAEERWQSAREVKLVLEWIAGTLHASQAAFVGAAPTKETWQTGKSVKIGAAASAILALVSTAGWLRERQSRPVPDLVEFTLPADDMEGPPVISPDGKYTAYAGDSGRAGVFLRALRDDRFTLLAGTEGGSRPCWSADSKWIAFYRNGLWKAPVPGGGPVEIASTRPFSSCAWSLDGNILLTTGGAVHSGAVINKVSAAGGTVTAFTKLEGGETTHRNPEFLNGGPLFIYHVGHPDSAKRGIYLASLLEPRGTLVMPTDSNAQFVPAPGSGEGFLVYAQGQSLMARAFDPENGRLAGEPFTVTSDFYTTPLSATNGLAAGLSASGTGSLCWRSSPPVSTRLLLVDANGREIATLAKSGIWRNPQFSPDGRRLAVTGEDGNYISELSSKPIYKFSSGSHPTWSPDAKTIAFSRNKGSGYRIFQKPADGSAEEAQLWDAGVAMFAQDWSRDGRYLLFTAAGPLREMAMPMAGKKHSGEAFDVTTADLSIWAAFSPNSKLMAWCTGSKGRWEIFVRGFRGSSGGLAGTEFQITAEGGVEPRWRGDSREIYFVSTDRKMLMAVEVNPETGQPGSAPRTLFPVDLTSTSYDRNGFDVSPDGKRFAVCVRSPEQPKPPVTVLLNWSAHAGR